jgi:hypothetical protein
LHSTVLAWFSADGRLLMQFRDTRPRYWRAAATRPSPPRRSPGHRRRRTARNRHQPRWVSDAPSGEFQFDGRWPNLTPPLVVIANADFGFQVPEVCRLPGPSTAALHQLTPWSNDPVGDARGEHYLLQDVDTGAWRSRPTPRMTQGFGGSTTSLPRAPRSGLQRV